MSSDSWVCESCTLENTPHVLCCVACGAKKSFSGRTNGVVTNGGGGDDDVVIMESEGWKCKRCTYINPETVARCEVCDSPRRSNLPSLSEINASIEAVSATAIPSTSNGDQRKKNVLSRTNKKLKEKDNKESSNSGETSATAINVDEQDDAEWKCVH